ncbi:hypothetical protein QW060_06295 [Myroides ceti]|uniref:Outer membrane protein beta-barrel domain-containing protein n=1 Tax=Paenimyroides ceti TaxID=395087 RepID=A0ABT8CRA6_9FLAO|nr:hypothetical protein [Paenimyroides ceti]MDN3706740.1 hypothetical protein [Paenimyroides ceti]
MKKIIYIGLLSVCIGSGNAFAQTSQTNDGYRKGFRLGFGINGGLEMNQKYEAALGADARLQYDLSQKTSVTFTSGYTHLFQEGDDAGFVPVKFGFKYFFANNFYALGEAGAAIGATGDLNNSLLLSPSVGFANKYIDISLRYENYTDYNVDQLGIRIAYGFSLKK